MNDGSLPTSHTPLRVMLLDDDIFMLEVLGEMLGQLGRFDVRCEPDSAQALATTELQQMIALQISRQVFPQ